jgi:cellulose synthase operon protein YhjQ
MTVRAVPDMATLYSRAHVEGTRYRDFSASSKQVRGRFRHQIVRKQTDLSGGQPAEMARRQTGEEVQTPVGPRSREGLAPRWYALHSVLTPEQIAAPPPLEPPPTLVLFSLAGGVGKTCLVATLGRALAALGEQVLLADTAACGLLQFYFGSRELRPGMVRTFSPPDPPPGVGENSPVQVLNLRTGSRGDSSEHDPWLGELVRDGRGANRILVDVATASREVASRLLLLRPTVLVPILPDMSSVASLALLEALLTGPASSSGQDAGPERPLYLLNQFDDSSPLHLDVRAMLQQQLGDRLLPFILRRCYAVSEALAEGMTVIDYAPDSGAAEDYRSLAGWLRNFAAPAEASYGGPRWSER